MSLNLRTVYQANHVLSFYWLVLLYTLLYTYHIILQLNLSVLLTLGAHAQEGYGTCPVCLSVCLFVCLSVCYHLIVDIVRFYGLPKVRAAFF